MSTTWRRAFWLNLKNYHEHLKSSNFSEEGREAWSDLNFPPHPPPHGSTRPINNTAEVMAMHIGLAKFNKMGFTALRQAIVTLDAAVLTPENAFFENAFFENAFFENAFFENFANFWRARSRL